MTILQPPPDPGTSDAFRSVSLLDLERVDSWPPELLRVLHHHCDVLYKYEEDFALPPRDPFTCTDSDLERAAAVGRARDRAISVVSDALRSYAIRGWHCTRLTDWEAQAIVADGLGLPDDGMLHRRIDRLVADGALTPDLADRLKARNQASESNRAGRIWFCFFPPRIASEGGIGRFFRHWGGEALYNSHEADPITSPILRTIGIPALVEADIPIALLRSHTWLPNKVARRFVVSRGCKTGEPVDHEDAVVHALPAACVRRVIRFPEPDFLALTGCADWCKPLA